MILKKNWVQKPIPGKQIIEDLSKALKINKTLSILIAQKGLRNFDEAKNYFNPTIDNLHDPYLMKGMDKAVGRIKDALHNGEKIMVYGDYDVDGTTSVAVVYSFLHSIYDKLIYYVPNRFEEGYGISEAGMSEAHSQGVSLVIALDCGIKDLKSIQLAVDKGMEVIVCDHHEPGETLPLAYAILNPKQKDCGYPFKELSGCGIGFKLIQALAQKLDDAPDPLSFVDYVAVSTASDIVPMVGENRIITYLGLKKINFDPSLPFKVMLTELDVKKKELDVSDLVFIIGPRLNASGRMQHASKTVEFLVEKDQDKIREFTQTINANNTDRKKEDSDIAQQVLDIINSDEALQNKKTTVLYGEEWHKGVIGIVASRVIEQYYRPTILLTESDGILSGSARSVPGFNLYQAIEKCSGLLLRFGGHEYAAGLSLKKENFEAFADQFEQVVSDSIDPACLMPSIKYNLELGLDQITLKFNNTLKRFAPFGPQNMKPVFVSKNVFLKEEPRVVGETHLKLSLALQNNAKVDAIGFGLGEYAGLLNLGKPFEICYTLDENVWNNVRSVQLILRDINLINS